MALNIQLQLCQPSDHRSPQRVHLETRGEGVFHLGFEVPDADAAESEAFGPARQNAGAPDEPYWLHLLRHGRQSRGQPANPGDELARQLIRRPETEDKMITIDLNSDLGESFGPWTMGDDAAMLGLVTSANVAWAATPAIPTRCLQPCLRRKRAA
jgi:hypothetical protein